MLRFRPRISLLTALLLMTILGMAISLWRLYAELAPLRREVVALRSQVGHLTIDDDKKSTRYKFANQAGFVGIGAFGFPKGYDYWFCASQKVPAKGLVSRESETFLGMGGQEINLRVEVLPSENGKRYVYVKSPAASCPFFEVEDAKWVNGRVMIGEDVTGAKSQVSSKVDEPLVLLRLSEDERTTKENPPRGLMIWISNARKP